MNPMQRPNLPLGLCFASWATDAALSHNNNILANTGVYDNKRERQSYKKSSFGAIDAKKTAANQLECADEIGRVVADVQWWERSKKHLLKKMHQNYDVPNSLTVLIRPL